MGDADLMWRIEQACLNACPSPRQLLHGDWLLRCSGGSVRRTNSVNPLRACGWDVAGVLGVARALYGQQGRAVIFRTPTFAGALDAPLAELGFVREGDTCTLLAPLGDARPLWDGAVELSARPSREWLEARARLAGAPEAEQWIYEAMLGAIVGPRAFAAFRAEGRIVSLGYGVIDDGVLVIGSVATDGAMLRRGLALRTVGKLMDWAVGQSARTAALQVEAANVPALGLYARLGFDRELYRYHYWREPSPAVSLRGRSPSAARPA